jgi:hypothetical protein
MPFAQFGFEFMNAQGLSVVGQPSAWQANTLHLGRTLAIIAVRPVGRFTRFRWK